MKITFLNAIVFLSLTAHAQDQADVAGPICTRVQECLELLDSSTVDSVSGEFYRNTGLDIRDFSSLKISLSDPETLLIENETLPEVSETHLFYVGASLGFMFPRGGQLIYQYRPAGGVTRVHAYAAAQSGSQFKTLSVGGAYHPFQRGRFFVGAGFVDTRYPLNRTESVHQPGVEPMLGWQGKLYRSRVIGEISIGAIKTFTSYDGTMAPLPVMADIKLTIAVLPYGWKRSH